jgi:alginate O-acetyltransferase complex protein AlgI
MNGMNGMELSASLLNLKFVLLLCCLGLMRAFWPQKHFALLIALSSALVIGLASPKTLLLIATITLLYLYPLHRLMRAVEIRGWSKTISRSLLWLGIAGLVAFLVVFKVQRFFTVPWLGGPRISNSILALVGFSYFMFRAISFLNIQAIIKFDEHAPWALLAYTLFPPTISSGPIQKYQDFRKELADPAPLSTALVLAASYRITRGYFRKVVLAFVLNEAISKVFSHTSLTVLTSTLVVALLYLYYYFDFAGYSDIAIGFGLLMGIRVPENFRKPFLATTVSEFWRNWHITLVDWFRDHVFIPLGGMQSSRIRAGLLACFTMVLCGAWHGLALSFLVWGIWHGLGLFLEAISKTRPIPPAHRHGIGYWTRVLRTNAWVAVGCILFLPDTGSILKVLNGFSKW